MPGLGDRAKTQRRRCDTTIDIALQIALGRLAVDKALAIVNRVHIKLTRVSRLFSRLRKSASSGEVMRIVESFCTMTLAKSRS
jgi:hypothetical protein